MIERIKLFIGKNDKNTKTQLINDADFIEIVSNELINNNIDCTMSSGIGIYTHENGSKIIENSIIVECLFCNLEKIFPVVDSLKIKLNQESIAIQHDFIESILR